ncbi:MAG: hypothetical protein QF756_06775, partial [Dehalococcoidia bacterium]|nr:hypothetical protein [Dehalococcoidia bacterium]
MASNNGFVIKSRAAFPGGIVMNRIFAVAVAISLIASSIMPAVPALADTGPPPTGGDPNAGGPPPTGGDPNAGG